MNILNEKRKAFGFAFMEGDGGGDGGGGSREGDNISTRDSNRDFDGFGSDSSPLSAPAPAPAPEAPAPAPEQDSGLSHAQAQAQAEAQAKAEANAQAEAASQAQAEAQAKAQAEAQDREQAQAQAAAQARAQADAAAQSNVSPLSSVEPPSTAKPGEDALSSATVNAYANMTPQQMSDMAHVLNLPAGDNYTYNFNDPGIPEAITKAFYVSPSDPSYALGMRAPGVTSDQMFNDETPAERNLRMQKVSDLIGNVAQGAIALSPVGGLFSGAKLAAGVLSGQQTPGDALSGMAFGLAGKALGISSGVVQSALAGDLGGVAQTLAMGELNKSIAQLTGLPSSVVSGLGNVTGLSKEIGSDIKSAVNDFTGDTSTGFTQSAVANAINGALPEASSGENSLASSDSSGSASTGTTFSGDTTGGISTGHDSSSSGQNPTPSTTTPAATNVASLSGLSSLGSSNSTYPWLDSTPQILKAAPVKSQNPAYMAQLKQLYQSLTPEMQDAFAMHEIQDPEMAAQGGHIGHYATGGKSAFQSAIDDMMPNFAKAPTMLEAAPVVSHPSRLGVLKPLHSGLTDNSQASGLAAGGLPHKYAEAAPEGHKPEFITGVTGYYAQGSGTGQSDDIPAMLHDGDYVIDAEAVSALGDGSSKAGAEALAKFQSQFRHHDDGVSRGKPVPAKIADGEYVFPAAFVTALGGGDNKKGAKLLDDMRVELRMHKRAAPTSKIPPKAESPLDYLKIAKG